MAQKTITFNNYTFLLNKYNLINVLDQDGNLVYIDDMGDSQPCTCNCISDLMFVIEELFPNKSKYYHKKYFNIIMKALEPKNFGISFL
jgi:hypothetical protein